MARTAFRIGAGQATAHVLRPRLRPLSRTRLCHPSKAFQAPRRFFRDDAGTMTVFALMMFVLMVSIGGIAIDIMRYETQRTQLQDTIDRAVLAAASLNQSLDPQDVVIDYLATSGLDRYRLDVNVDEGLNYRRVEAYAEMDVQSYFLNMFGVNALTTPARGTAEERVMNVEISMVLDISGSMGWNQKMQNMQSAANDFVDTVLEANSGGEQLVSVSVVPYNDRVNAGSTIESVFTLSDEHTQSSCTRFAANDFRTTAINPALPIERLAHFDRIYANYYTTFRYPHCPTSDYAAILPWSNDATALHDRINSLHADGWTAIDLGMKWGVGLLDPAAQPAVTQLVSDGTVDASFDGRPVSFADGETLKIVVLMTDGENTYQYDIAQDRKSGGSNVWRDPDTGRTSAYLPNYDLYYWHHNRTYHNEPYGGANAEQIPWTELWATYTARMLAGEYFYYAGDWNYYNSLRYNSVETYAGPATADTNLRNICDAANDAGIVVFTIGFEAPADGQDIMQYCATTPAHYYDVQGIEIGEAFASIASTINQLRLIE